MTSSMSAAATNSTVAETNASWPSVRSTAAAACSICRSRSSVTVIVDSSCATSSRSRSAASIFVSLGRQPLRLVAAGQLVDHAPRGVGALLGGGQKLIGLLDDGIGLDSDVARRSPALRRPRGLRLPVPRLWLCANRFRCAAESARCGRRSTRRWLHVAAAAISSASRTCSVSRAMASAAACAAACRALRPTPAARSARPAQRSALACRCTRSSTSATAAAHCSYFGIGGLERFDGHRPLTGGAPGRGEVAGVLGVDPLDQQRLGSRQRSRIARRDVERPGQRIAARQIHRIGRRGLQYPLGAPQFGVHRLSQAWPARGRAPRHRCAVRDAAPAPSTGFHTSCGSACDTRNGKGPR